MSGTGNGYDDHIETLVESGQIVDISAFRKKRGRDGLVAVRLSDDLVVKCIVTNMETLVLEKRIPEPLVAIAIEVATGATGGRAAKMDMNRLLRSIELQDIICGEIIRVPRWYLTKELSKDEDGRTIPPENGLCLADLSDEERGAIAQLVYGGITELERFRKRLRKRDNDISDGARIQEAAERASGADADELSSLREDDVRPGDSGAWSGDGEDRAGEIASAVERQPTRLERSPGF